MANKLSYKTSALLASAMFVPLCLAAQELASPAAEFFTTTSASATAVLGNIPPDIKLTAMTLGSGGITGWAVGFTLKKFAKLAALIVGVAFISIQYLAFNRFITIDWERIRQTVPEETLERSWVEGMSVLTYNLPFAGSFVAGFWYGFRKG